MRRGTLEVRRWWGAVKLNFKFNPSLQVLEFQWFQVCATLRPKGFCGHYFYYRIITVTD